MESSIKELASYRFLKAKEDLKSAESLFNDANYRLSMNRSYYAVFHAIRSMNTLAGFDSSKHSGVIAFFNQTYVKTGVFDKNMSKIIRKTSECREQADYEDFFVATEETAKEILALSKTFIEVIEKELIKREIIEK